MTAILTPNQKLFHHWVTTREQVRIARAQGKPFPWSDDEIINATHWCNINRENDRVTKWIRNRYGMNTPTESPTRFTTMMVIARVINLPAMLETLPVFTTSDDMWDWCDHFHRIADMRLARGDRVWNSAYVITTCGVKMSKVTYCAELFERAYEHIKALPDNAYGSCDSLYRELLKIKGLSTFLSGQVVADCKNTDNHPLKNAGDWHEFVAPGPGSRRGLKWFWEAGSMGREFVPELHRAKNLMEDHDDWYWDMCAQDFQNCMCEYDKYMRIRNGGRAKRKFKGAK